MACYNAPGIQIHPMLRLNANDKTTVITILTNSNTSHVTVKQMVNCSARTATIIQIHPMLRLNIRSMGKDSRSYKIQIHPMLRLNIYPTARRSRSPCIQIHPMLRLNGVWAYYRLLCLPIQIHPMLRLNLEIKGGNSRRNAFKYIPCYG